MVWWRSVLVAILLAGTAADARRSSKKVDIKPYQCRVCLQIGHEIEVMIDATPNGQRLVQTRFRLDEKKRVPFARSEGRVSEIVDTMRSKITGLGVAEARADNGDFRLVPVKPENEAATLKHKRTVGKAYDSIMVDAEETVINLWRDPTFSGREALHAMCVDTLAVCSEVPTPFPDVQPAPPKAEEPAEEVKPADTQAGDDDDAKSVEEKRKEIKETLGKITPVGHEEL